MIYRFGGYELDTAQRELRLDGARVEVEPKAFEMLIYLANNADRAISKDELQNQIWPRSIVTETALTRCVMKARRAVGDDANKQDVIRTVHGHGYRFIASESETTVTPEAPPQRSLRPAFVTAVLVLLAIAGGAQLFKHAGETVLPERLALAVLPVTNRIVDSDHEWVRVGLMGLLNRMLEDVGVTVVADRSVLSAVGDSSIPSPMDTHFLERLRNVVSASQVLDTTLEHTGGVYRLSATLALDNGKVVRRVIVGETPTTVAADMATVLAGLLVGKEDISERPLRRVSTDPFVNEAYARALDMELSGDLEEARSLFRVAAKQEPNLFWLRYEIALCTRDLREWDAAAQQFDTLLAEALAANDSDAQIATLNSAGVMWLKREKFDDAERVFSKALQLAEGSVFAGDRAVVNINLALIASNRGDRTTAASHYQAALDTFGDAETQPSPTFLNNYAGLLISEGRLDEAADYSEQAVAGFQLRGQRRFEATALNRLAKILRRRGDLDDALARQQQALAIHRELNIPTGQIIVQLAMVNVHRDKGALSQARQLVQDVKERVQLLDHVGLQADAHMYAAQVEEDFREFESARSEYVAAQNIFASQGTPPGLRYAEEGVARTTFRLGDNTGALAQATALYQSAAGNDDRAAARAERLLAEILHANGDSEQATEIMQRIIDDARTRNDEIMRTGTTIELADIYVDLERWEEADALLSTLDERRAATPAALRILARLQIARDERSQATETLALLRKAAGEGWNGDDEALLASVSDE